MRAVRETSKFHKLSPFINSVCCYMVKILPIWRKTLYNQSINQIPGIYCTYTCTNTVHRIAPVLILVYVPSVDPAVGVSGGSILE